MAHTGKKWWQKIIREPLVHFLLLGGALYLIYTHFSTAGAETFLVSGQTTGYLIRAEEKKMGRKLSPAERSRLIDNYIDEEILLREAYKQGMDRSDPYIRKRLIDKMKFSLYSQSFRPDDQTLRRYYEKHKENYASGIRISFDQIFFTREQYDTLKNKEHLETVLNSDTDPSIQGSPFPQGKRFENRSKMELIRIFGTSFVNRIQKFPAGRWYGPVASKQGIHWVKITGKQITGYLPFEAVKPSVMNDYIQQRQQAEWEHKIDSIKSGYRIIIEPF